MTKHYDIDFSVTGSMRISVEIDTEKSPNITNADQIEAALESGALSISSDDGGEAILNADGTVVGRTLHVRDETDWTDFSVWKTRGFGS